MNNRPFSKDSEGKEWLIKKLKNIGFDHIVDTDVYAKTYHYDIEGYYKGKKWIFELKNRDLSSDCYSDVMMNRKQYRTIRWEVEADYKILFYFWNDHYTVIDLQKNIPESSETIECSRTKRIGDHRVIKKDMVIWNNDAYKLFDY